MDLSLILIVVIALLSALQAVLLVLLAIEGRRTLRGFERLAEELTEGLAPVAGHLAQAASNAADVSERALEGALRVDAALHEAAVAWTTTTARIQEVVTPNLGRLAGVASAWRIFRRGWALYRRLRG
jgi:hypothetical protein